MTRMQIEEAIWAELENYTGKDVRVYYELGSHRICWALYIWSGETHQETTIHELRNQGFDLDEIKILREETDSFTVKHICINKLQIKR